MKTFDRGGRGAALGARVPSRSRALHAPARGADHAPQAIPGAGRRRALPPAAPAAVTTPPLDPGVRLGRVESRILDEVQRRGGLAPRYALVDHVFPDLGPKPRAGGGARGAQRLERWQILRADAESAVSRAIRSLGRKGLLLTERSTQTGRTLLREPGVAALPEWEEVARAEEDLASRCQELARELVSIAGRARTRAISIRTQCSDAGVAAERDADERLLEDVPLRLAL